MKYLSGFALLCFALTAAYSSADPFPWRSIGGILEAEFGPWAGRNVTGILKARGQDKLFEAIQASCRGNVTSSGLMALSGAERRKVAQLMAEMVSSSSSINFTPVTRATPATVAFLRQPTVPSRAGSLRPPVPYVRPPDIRIRYVDEASLRNTKAELYVLKESRTKVRVSYMVDRTMSDTVEGEISNFGRSLTLEPTVKLLKAGGGKISIRLSSLMSVEPLGVELGFVQLRPFPIQEYVGRQVRVRLDVSTRPEVPVLEGRIVQARDSQGGARTEIKLLRKDGREFDFDLHDALDVNPI